MSDFSNVFDEIKENPLSKIAQQFSMDIMGITVTRHVAWPDVVGLSRDGRWDNSHCEMVGETVERCLFLFKLCVCVCVGVFV